MFARFPQEIIENIFWSISIEECNSCKDAYEYYYNKNVPKSTIFNKKMNMALNTRKNQYIYFGMYFPNVEALLARMLFDDVIVYGSRAIQFFTGDAIDKYSNWDFLIPKDVRKIINFMEFTSRNGFKWYTTLDSFIQKLDSNKDETISMFEASFLVRYNKNVFEPYVHKAISCIGDIVTKNGLRSYITISNYTYRVAVDKKDGSTKYIYITDYSTNELYTINGSIMHDNKSTKVRLIISDKNSDNSTLNNILSNPTTISQCFISPLMAVHMNKSDAYLRKSKVYSYYYGMLGNQKVDIENYILKYTKRGYLFTYSDKVHYTFELDYIKRCIKDIDCEVIPFNFRSDFVQKTYDDGVVKMTNCIQEKQHILYSFTWLYNIYGSKVDHYSTIRFNNFIENIQMKVFRDNVLFANKHNIPTTEVRDLFDNFASLNFSREYINDVYEEEECQYINKAYYNKFQAIYDIRDPLLSDDKEISSDDNSD